MRDYLIKNQRAAKDSFPWTTLSNEQLSDVLRAYELLATDNGLELLLSGETPPGSFNSDVVVFKSAPGLGDPLTVLMDHFIKSRETRQALSEA